MEGVALIVAVIAFFIALGARSRAAGLQARLAGLQDELRSLRTQIALAQATVEEAPAAHAALSPSEPPQTASAPEKTAAAAVPVVEPQMPVAGSVVAEPEPVAAEPQTEAVESTGAMPGPSVPEPPVPEPQIAAIESAGAIPEPPADAQQPVAASAPPAPTRATLEEQLGARWAVWVGGLALALGGVLLVLYSIEQGIFGPRLRIALGAAFSLVLLAAGEWFRRSERASPIAVVPSAHIPGILTAAGTVSAFGTVYAAHALYGFIPPAATFVVLAAIALATMSAAALHGPALAGLGLAGALGVPLLITSQDPNPWPVVLYLAVVAAAAYALARLRRWLWLTAAAAAGAIVWGVALMAPVSSGAAGAWTPALFTHVGLQLALAALFFAVVPHLAARDADARLDWIATLALATFAVLAIVALDSTSTHGQWVAFAMAMVATLALTAWYSAPAAGAAVLAGLLALAAMVVWPSLLLLPEARLMTPGPRVFAALLDRILRLPDKVSSFQGFAALSTLTVATLTTHRMWRGRALPLATAGCYALAAVAVPLLALVLAYLRAAQLDRSIPYALCAAAVAAAFGLLAFAFARSTPGARTPVASLVIGAFGSGAATAVALALVMALDRGYLTVALAIAAFATSMFAVAGRVAVLRYVVVAIGLAVLGRLVWEPRIMGADVGTWPILNWLLLGYGVPAIAFLAAARVLGRETQDLAARLCDALGVLFAALLVFFQIRHALNGGDPLAPTSGHIEQGLLTLMSIGFAAVLIRMDVARGNPVFRAAALIFGVLSAAVTVVGLGLAQNPLFTGEAVLGPVVLSSLVLAYLVPALGALVLARIARGVRPDWYVNGATGLALMLLFGYAALEVRHAFHGQSLSLWLGTSLLEVGLLALTSLGFAAALVRLDAARADPALRGGSLVLGGLAGAIAAIGLGLLENPLFTGEPVHGPVVFNTLSVAYLLPALGAIVLTRIARGVRPERYVSGAAALALLLLFGYVTLELRHAFQGESLALWQGASAPEVWSYSVAWLALGLLFLFYGVWRGSTEARLASAALVVLSVLKVFLYDLTGIGGFWRAFSVICLGAVLIGIGLVYQKLVFARPQAPTGA